MDPTGPPKKVKHRAEKAMKTTPPKKAQAQGARRTPLTEQSMKPGAAHGVRLGRTYFHFPLGVARVKKDTTVCQFHRLANKVINNSNNKGARLGTGHARAL